MPALEGRLMARIKRAKPDDELTLVEHLDELRTRLIVSLTVLVVAVSACYYENHRLYHLLTKPLPGRPRGSSRSAPSEAFFNAVTISVYGGLLISLPILSYQFYAYIIPAFSEESQRTIRPMLLLVPGLFLLGVVFGWFIVDPAGPALPDQLQQPRGALPATGKRLHPLHHVHPARHGGRVRDPRCDDDARPGRHPALVVHEAALARGHRRPGRVRRASSRAPTPSR